MLKCQTITLLYIVLTHMRYKTTLNYKYVVYHQTIRYLNCPLLKKIFLRNWDYCIFFSFLLTWLAVASFLINWIQHFMYLRWWRGSPVKWAWPCSRCCWQKRMPGSVQLETRWRTSRGLAGASCLPDHPGAFGVRSGDHHHRNPGVPEATLTAGVGCVCL